MLFNKNIAKYPELIKDPNVKCALILLFIFKKRDIENK